MARPVVSAPAEELYEALDPAFTQGDEDRLWATLNLCQALVPEPVRQLHTYVSDQEDGTPGWVIALDPTNAPAEVLPWLAQFDGAVLRPDMTEEQMRDAIREPEGFGRGRPSQIIAVAKRHLTGSKTVILTERYTGNAWRMQITTLGPETPDPALTEAEIRAEAKPIGIVLFFNEAAVWDWAELRAEEATWLSVRTDFATWFDVRTHVP